MEKGKFTREDIKSFIIYALEENNIDINKLDSKKIEKIIEDYLSNCIQFKSKYVIGELDTFKKAGCLLVAIVKNKIVLDKKINAQIAIDASQKMCEKPYWNVGRNADIPHKLEEVDFKSVLECDPYLYNKHRELLIEAILYDENSITPLSIHSNLELFYRIAVENKKIKLQQDIERINKLPEQENGEDKQSSTNQTDQPQQMKKRRFPFFKR